MPPSAENNASWIYKLLAAFDALPINANRENPGTTQIESLDLIGVNFKSDFVCLLALQSYLAKVYDSLKESSDVFSIVESSFCHSVGKISDSQHLVFFLLVPESHLAKLKGIEFTIAHLPI